MILSLMLCLGCTGNDPEPNDSDNTGADDPGPTDTGSDDTGDTGPDDTGETGEPPLDRFTGDIELFDAPGLIRGTKQYVPLGLYVSRGAEGTNGHRTFWVTDAQYELAYAWDSGVLGEQTQDDADLQLKDPNSETYSYFGYASVGDQDLNGDQVADFAVVAPGVGGTSHVSVFQGAPSAGDTPIASISGPNQGFGWSIAAVHYDTAHVAVTTPNGGVYLFASPSGDVAKADYDVHLSNAAGWNDVQVDRAGDLDGDGIDELIVSSRDRVYVLKGPLSGDVDLNDADAIITTMHILDYLTAVGRGGGDLDGDGREDLIVGSPYSNGMSGFAAVLTRPMSASSDLTDAEILLEYSGGRQALFGYSLDAAGDVDADGQDDVIIGAPELDSSGAARGEAFLWYGPLSPGTHGSDNAEARFYSDTDRGHLGIQVLGLGDTNGDGASDLLISAPYLTSGKTSGVVGVWSL